ncbi:MAG: cupin domain-containing protein [candidate division Zixibacteria bacterium]|nr:cupin domain-containing protein [candidate division Zixibacteria bacterium]
MYFVEEENMSQKSIAPGVSIAVAGGERAQMSFVTLTPGSQVPMHDHPHEQLGVVLEGEFVMVIGGESRTIRTGDKYVIPGGVQHGVTEVKTRSVALDIFSPPREDYA